MHHMRKAPSVPMMTSAHQQHGVMRKEGHPSNIVVRHPALPGPNMMAPRPDHAELPAGSMNKHSAPGGIIGGLAPFQSEQGAVGGEFQ